MENSNEFYYFLKKDFNDVMLKSSENDKFSKMFETKTSEKIQTFSKLKR